MTNNSKPATQNRWKSWALWLSIAALIVYMIKVLFHIDVTKEADTLMNLLFPILVGFGIINNPTDCDHL